MPLYISLKHAVKNMPLYISLKRWVSVNRQKKELVEWERNGKPVPPPNVVKQLAIKSLAKKFGLKILVETGTCYGDMVDAMKDSFSQIYSIELSNELYEKAKKRFAGRENVTLIKGDSGIELGNLVGKIDQSALFWLDAHYSAGVTARGAKDTPVYEELSNIFSVPNRGHVIVIDDARCFGTDPAYPSIQKLSDFINAKSPNAEIVIADDSIRITQSKLPD
jgi:hypothetical protein